MLPLPTTPTDRRLLCGVGGRGLSCVRGVGGVEELGVSAGVAGRIGRALLVAAGAGMAGSLLSCW